MSLKMTQNFVFSLHSVCAYSRATGLPYSTPEEVAMEMAVSAPSELIKLEAGPSQYPHAVGKGRKNSEVSFKTSALSPYLFTLFEGIEPTVVDTPDTNGIVGTPVNKYGTSMVNATTGIASAALKTGSEADLKTARYALKAISATAVAVYLLTTADKNRGTNLSFQDSYGQIIATAT